jgi:hypothetical protein
VATQGCANPRLELANAVGVVSAKAFESGEAAKTKTASDCNHFSRSPFSMRAMLIAWRGEGFVAAWGKTNLRKASIVMTI